jgi:uncharacterized protein YbjQ (UPF0145 family)
VGVCRQCGDETLDEYLVEGRCGACDQLLTQEPTSELPYAHMPIATVNSIGGRRIIATIDVVSAECVFGVNIFTDIFVSVRNFVGGRSASYQKVLREAKEICFSEIRRDAYTLGANAVIGLELDYSSITPSGDAGSLLMLVVTGTAVVVEDVSASTEKRTCE